MSRREKAQKKGVIAQYITRNAALRRLQLSLAQFRRLCIYKGVYPREPKRRPKNSHSISNVYYHSKDILYLSHDTALLDSLRSNKSEAKKYNKAINKRDYSKAKLILRNKKSLQLHQTVKQRYPTFQEALENLDDPLSTISLFASMKVIRSKGLKPEMIKECNTLMNHFYYFICKTKSLVKTFISIKGYYYQAEVEGVKILWLVPHQFAQNIPSEVDFKVLSSFLDFYCTLMRFVNFKLFTMSNLRMPPVCSTQLYDLGYNYLAYTDLLNSSEQRHTSDTQYEQGPQQSKKLIFKDLVFYVSREVPLQNVALVILSGGGRLGWQGEGSPLTMNDPCITHCVVDRPIEYFKRIEGIECEYIQPQWLFDSFNLGIVLPIEDYTVGRTLPPHLSPFVDDEAEGYIPKQREKFNELIKQNQTQTNTVEDAHNSSHTASTQEIERIYKQEYNLELKKYTHSTNDDEEDDTQLTPQITVDTTLTNKLDTFNSTEQSQQTNIELRKGLLNKKHRRLYDRIQKSKEKKTTKHAKLQEKRRQLESQTNH